MTEVISENLRKSINVDRLIGVVKGSEPGPTLIFLGGIHGNEPTGVIALQRIIEELEKKPFKFRGNLYAIAGNRKALAAGTRFNSQDLNRLWTGKELIDLLDGDFDPKNEDQKEQLEIQKTLDRILIDEDGPFYFFDLHTTSCETVPFTTVNDARLNRKFAQEFPVPMILGIEEYLEGPLLSYINELGFVAFGFEGGQHYDDRAIENHMSFIYLAMGLSGMADKADINFEKHYKALASNTKKDKDIYEIIHLYGIEDHADFNMKPGYINFQEVINGEHLGYHNGKVVMAPRRGKIFMPLYQGQGNDGYFLIRRVPYFFLKLSTVFRKLRLDRILVLLPGVQWLSLRKDALVVNRRIARFFTKQLFHLMGYRSKTLDDTHYIMRNREVASREADYEGSEWL